MKKALFICLIVGISSMQSVISMETKQVNLRELLTGTAVGAAVGCGEVVCNQPWIVLKNMLQLPKKERAKAFSALSKKTIIPIFYRGLGTNLAGMGPATAFQIGTNEGLNTVIAGNDFQHRLARAACAGVLSALVATPIERVIVMQQVMQCSPSLAIKAIAAHGGVLSLNRAFMLTAAREGVWAPAYLALFPALEKTFADGTNSKTTGLFGAAAATAVLMVMITQPADTLKTVLQSDCAATYKNSLAALRAICAEVNEKTKKPGGWRNLWKGAVPRAMRASLAIPFLKYSSEYLRSKVEKLSSTSNKT